MACVRRAVILVDLTNNAQRARRTRTHKVVNQIMARSAILARVWFAVVDVQLTILPLKTFGAYTLIGSHQVTTRTAILARS